MLAARGNCNFFLPCPFEEFYLNYGASGIVEKNYLAVASNSQVNFDLIMCASILHEYLNAHMLLVSTSLGRGRMFQCLKH